jgi:L-amino acid N-acyltransferase YncA
MSVFVRDAGVGDVPAIVAIYSPFVVRGTVTLELEPPDDAEIERRMVAVQDAGLPFVVAELDGEAVGYGYCGQFRPRAGYRFTVEDSVYVRADKAGHGIGRRLLTTLVERCTAADCRQMVAVIGGKNSASVAMHAALGFVQVGVLREVGFKFGQWHDVTLMQRELKIAAPLAG